MSKENTTDATKSTGKIKIESTDVSKNDNKKTESGTFNSTLNSNDSTSSAIKTGDIKVSSIKVDPAIVTGLTGEDVVEVDAITTANKEVSSKEERTSLSTTDKKPTKEEIKEVKESITDLNKDVKVEYPVEAKVEGLDSAKKADKPAVIETKIGTELYSKVPLVEIIRKKEFADVKVDLTNAKREFNSEMNSIDGFKVDGKSYDYKFEKTKGLISGIPNERAGDVARVLMSMIGPYTNKTE